MSQTLQVAKRCARPSVLRQTALLTCILATAALTASRHASAQQAPQQDSPKAHESGETSVDDGRDVCEDTEVTIDVCEGDKWYTCVCTTEKHVVLPDLRSGGFPSPQFAWVLQHPTTIHYGTQSCESIGQEAPAHPAPGDIRITCIQTGPPEEIKVDSEGDLTPSPQTLPNHYPDPCDERSCDDKGISDEEPIEYVNEDGELCVEFTRVRDCEPKQD